jgi:hypothetical protein
LYVQNEIPTLIMARFGQVALGLCVLVLPSCTAVHEPAANHASLQALAPEIQRAWLGNHATLDRIVPGRQFDGAEYARAVEFFERLTGIRAHDNKSFLGRLANEQLQADLHAWDTWLEGHAACLRWNAVQGVVECVGTAGSI